jgi:hypothetical protein
MHLDRPGVSAARAACLVTSPLIHPWLCFSIRDASLQQPLCTCSNRKNRLPAPAPIFLCFLYFLSGSFARHFHSGSFRISLLLKHPSQCVLKQASSHRELLARLKVKTRTQRAAEVRRVTGTERLQQCVCVLIAAPLPSRNPFPA